MVKLLRADLSRMFGAKSFWVCAALSAALSVLNCLTLNPGWEEHTARLILSGGSNAVLFMAIFSALFLGTDYSHGTIRNKLIVGSKRTDIYFSALMTAIAGDHVIALAAYIPKIITACFGKTFGMSANEFAFLIIITVCAFISVSAIFALLGMLITSRSKNTAITITATFVLILGAAIIMELLNAPEMVSDYVITAEGGFTQTEPYPNPAYIPPGAKRTILTAVNDVLPTGQIMQMELGELHNMELMPLYSLGVLAVTTAAGAVLFRKKDLK